ncbi:ribbon-helix-helix domain-containing protein [Xanthobacteraceae bacterium Astr-EGSB]|uniref:ribbon-helix-helix domain-containing protein n=1 Tax=Astrobacterium formosum TaxID=3069710 RepID=UPI0027B0CA57|nr:ribbon-helix-helix domain-containing protein [Xanthobacteraceae bacterium Astr-EGSB]
MKSSVIKRSVAIGGRRTSVSLEEPFWSSIKEIANQRSMTVYDLITQLHRERGEQRNLSSCIRLFVLAHFQSLSTEPTPMINAREPEGKV